MGRKAEDAEGLDSCKGLELGDSLSQAVYFLKFPPHHCQAPVLLPHPCLFLDTSEGVIVFVYSVLALCLPLIK